MKRKIKAGIYIVLGLLFIAYYFVCVAWAWSGVSWLWLWPLLAAFCFIRAFSLKFRFPKWISVLYYTLFAVFLALFVVVEAQIITTMNTQPEPDADYIIVLGAAVRGDEPTTPMLLRIDRAYDYMEENPDTILIASGGQGKTENMSEAECIRLYLTDWGIPDSRIIKEDKSTSTEENISNSFALIPESAGRVGILTNSFHLYRALLIAHGQGYDNVFGIPARTLLPLGIHYTVREFFGVIKLQLQNLKGGNPVYVY
jgi:Uncharacterized conserved protein